MSTLTEIATPLLTGRIRERALELGFDHVGIAPIEPSRHASAYREWVAAGYAGEMAYLTRPDAVERRADPRLAVPGARSAIVVARNHFPGDAPPHGAGGREPSDDSRRDSDRP